MRSWCSKLVLAVLALSSVAAGERDADLADVADPADVIVGPVRVTAAPPDRDDGPAGEGSAAPEARRALDEPAFVTVVDVGRARGELAPVAEVLAESVGASVRSLGGLGAFTSISLRGAPAAQTEILVDGVPLSRVAFSALDVGDLDLGTFDRVEIYRGGVPVELGGAALGGAVNFVTSVGPIAGRPSLTLTLGGGSFGARRARAVRRAALLHGRLLATLAVGYAGATGDYEMFDDRGTPLNPDDDGRVRRTNNGFDRLDAVVRLRGRPGPLTIDGGQRLSWKWQGVPGPSGVMAQNAALGTLRSVTDLRLLRPRLFGWSPLDGAAAAFFVAERQRWQDREGEIGLGQQDRGYTTLAGGLALRAGIALGAHHLVAAAVEPRVEWFAEDDLMAGGTPLEGFRAGAGLSASDQIVLGADEQLVVLPALRLDVLASRRRGDSDLSFEDDDAPASRTDLHLSPRVGVRWAATPALSVKANVGRYFRPPTLVELYGDRGVVVGNPALVPETGISGDVGLVVAPPGRAGAVDRLFLEIATFASRPRDLIALVPTSGRVAVARNLGEARLGGHEVALSARFFRTVTVTGNYTFLDSAQRSPLVSADGKRLPGRPRHEAYGRIDVARRLGPRRLELGGYVDATWVDGNFLDVGNLNQVPARRLLGAGVRVVTRGGLVAALEVKNLLDEIVEDVPLARAPRPGLDSIPRAVSDVLGYPLPGRAVYATVEWSF